MNAALAAGLVLLAGLSLLVGAAGFGVPDGIILWQLRMPRTGLALVIGAGLGLSGAVLQGALRNPLADPGLLGIGGAAALGGVVVFYWGLSAALLALALTLAPNPFALAEIAFWLMGGLEDRTLTHLAIAGPLILIGLGILLRLGPSLDALGLGEATAASLGRPASRTLIWTALGVTLAVGPGAAVAGGIGFVGLVVPHLLRPWCGQAPSRVLGASALAGAMLVLGADILARAGPLLLPLQAEPRLGVLTALLGTLPVAVRVMLCP